MAANISIVEVVYASETNHTLLSVRIPEFSTIREAIIASGMLELYPELALESLQVGIFSQLKTLEDTLRSEDRIEIYRSLLIDPKEARRARAKRLTG